jgi:hypothetical protein
VRADREGPSKFSTVLVEQGGHAIRVRSSRSGLLAGAGARKTGIFFRGCGGGAGPPVGRQPHPLPAATRHDHMPVVLDGVVGAAREEPGDDGPAVAVDAV